MYHYCFENDFNKSYAWYILAFQSSHDNASHLLTRTFHILTTKTSAKNKIKFKEKQLLQVEAFNSSSYNALNSEVRYCTFAWFLIWSRWQFCLTAMGQSVNPSTVLHHGKCAFGARWVHKLNIQSSEESYVHTTKADP